MGATTSILFVKPLLEVLLKSPRSNKSNPDGNAKHPVILWIRGTVDINYRAFGIIYTKTADVKKLPC